MEPECLESSLGSPWRMKRRLLAADHVNSSRFEIPEAYLPLLWKTFPDGRPLRYSVSMAAVARDARGHLPVYYSPKPSLNNI